MLISVNSISKSFADELLFDSVSFSVEEGDKIGFVGANGAGKSTLIRILMGEMEADGGEIFKNRFTKIGYLEQYACADSDRSMYDELMEEFSEQRECEELIAEINLDLEGSRKGDIDLIEKLTRLNERFGEIGGFTYKSRIRSALMGLGFSEDEFKKKVSDLSGGQKTRVALAKILLSDCNLLFLDEPTNHLDTDSIQYLEDFIKSSKAAFIIISHDRYFLDRVTGRTFSLEDKRFHSMNLPYSAFHAQREIEKLTEKRNYDNTMREIERLESVIEQQRRWNREKNIKTAESKQKVVDKLRETLVEPESEQKRMLFGFGGVAGGGDNILICENISKSFGEKKIFKNFNMHIRRGERVFLLGANGCGKTTLLKIAQEKLSSDSGSTTIGANVHIGYYDQIQEGLSPEKRIIDEIWDEFPKLTETEVRNALAAFLFRGEEVERTINKLSGGERARVELTKLALRKVNFLILDEPTNHLDIASREALEEALSGFSGTILAVSHDRYFINRLATRIVHMNQDGSQSYEGDYDYYIEKRKDGALKKQEVLPKKTAADDYKEQKMQAAAKRKAENDAKKAEEKIAQLENEIESLNEELASEAVATDYVKAQEISEKIDSLNEELGKQYQIWENAMSFNEGGNN